MDRYCLPRLALLLGLLTLLPAQAAEVAGVKLDEQIRLGDSDLTLNGAGLRKKLFFKVYVAGLYLPKRGASASDILTSPAPKRVQLVMLRELTAEAFMEALNKGIDANLTAAEKSAVKARLDGFGQLVLSLGKAREGDVFQLDETAAGSQLMVNGKAQGKPIAGADFYRALLKVWLGEHPVQDDLKQALLGAAG
jgi:hypothetical protein